MRLYIGKRLRGGWGVGTRIGGGSRSSTGFLHLVFAIVAIALVVTYWKLAIGVFVAWLVFAAIWASRKEARKEKLARLTHAAKLGERVSKHLDMVNNGKTLSTRLNNCVKAIELLKEIAALDPNSEAVGGQSELLPQLQATKKVLPIVNALEKVEKAEFKGQKKLALNGILDALFQCQKDSITDADFTTVGLTTGPDGQLVTLGYLSQKAKGLGWTPP